MKRANVVQVRDLGPLTAVDSAIAETESRLDRMTTLLHRYPQIGDPEKAELLLFLRKGASHDVARLGRRDGLAPRLAQFRRDHWQHFQPSHSHIAAVLAIVLLPLAALVWLYFG